MTRDELRFSIMNSLDWDQLDDGHDIMTAFDAYAAAQATAETEACAVLIEKGRPSCSTCDHRSCQICSNCGMHCYFIGLFASRIRSRNIIARPVK